MPAGRPAAPPPAGRGPAWRPPVASPAPPPWRRRQCNTRWLCLWGSPAAWAATTGIPMPGREGGCRGGGSAAVPAAATQTPTKGAPWAAVATAFAPLPPQRRRLRPRWPPAATLPPVPLRRRPPAPLHGRRPPRSTLRRSRERRQRRNGQDHCPFSPHYHHHPPTASTPDKPAIQRH